MGVIEVVFPTKYANFVEKYSKEYGVDKNLVYAVIRCESSFNPKAKSRKGAMGLMQLTPSTASWCAQLLCIAYEDENLFEEEYNIRIGTYYLSYLSSRFSEPSHVIMAYNAGEGNVKKWLDNNGEVFNETATYLNRVKLAYTVYKLKNYILTQ